MLPFHLCLKISLVHLSVVCNINGLPWKIAVFLQEVVQCSYEVSRAFKGISLI
jgi:hypothetical protein